jgi:SAM-dependent methyltransferase
MTTNYEIKLLKQFANAKLGTQKIYYEDLYKGIRSNLSESSKILEIGAGCGISSIFIEQENIIRTDFLPWKENPLVRGDINAEKMPFIEDTFEIVFGVDVLHHLTNPLKALEEVSRVLKTDCKAIFIEPYVSPFSYIIYKLFHDEETSFRYRLSRESNRNSPQDGDQGIAKAIFCSKKGLRKLSTQIPQIFEVNTKLLHPFSFFITGGLTNPINSGKILIRVLLKIEYYVPRFILKLFASRIQINLIIKK